MKIRFRKIFRRSYDVVSNDAILGQLIYYDQPFMSPGYYYHSNTPCSSIVYEGFMCFVAPSFWQAKKELRENIQFYENRNH